MRVNWFNIWHKSGAVLWVADRCGGTMDADDVSFLTYYFRSWLPYCGWKVKGWIA